MNIFDGIIEEVTRLLKTEKSSSYAYSSAGMAKSTKKHELILGSESAYELGASDKSCVNFVALTMREDLVFSDEVVVFGGDLQDITQNSNFARITLIRTDDISTKGEQTAYNIFKEIELSKFNVAIDGYMMRSSGLYGREQVRVSKKILKKGIDFAGVGNRFISQYKTNRHVLAVKVIFITLDNFCYEQLENLAEKSNRRIKALNHMLSDLKMDCKACEWKPVCDEVDGMKEMHQSILK